MTDLIFYQVSKALNNFQELTLSSEKPLQEIKLAKSKKLVFPIDSEQKSQDPDLSFLHVERESKRDTVRPAQDPALSTLLLLSKDSADEEEFGEVDFYTIPVVRVQIIVPDDVDLNSLVTETRDKLSALCSAELPKELGWLCIEDGSVARSNQPQGMDDRLGEHGEHGWHHHRVSSRQKSSPSPSFTIEDKKLLLDLSSKLDLFDEVDWENEGDEDGIHPRRVKNHANTGTMLNNSPLFEMHSHGLPSLHSSSSVCHHDDDDKHVGASKNHHHNPSTMNTMSPLNRLENCLNSSLDSSNKTNHGIESNSQDPNPYAVTFSFPIFAAVDENDGNKNKKTHKTTESLKLYPQKTKKSKEKHDEATKRGKILNPNKKNKPSSPHEETSHTDSAEMQSLVLKQVIQLRGKAQKIHAKAEKIAKVRRKLQKKAKNLLELRKKLKPMMDKDPTKKKVNTKAKGKEDGKKDKKETTTSSGASPLISEPNELQRTISLSPNPDEAPHTAVDGFKAEVALPTQDTGGVSGSFDEEEKDITKDPLFGFLEEELHKKLNSGKKDKRQTHNPVFPDNEPDRHQKSIKDGKDEKKSHNNDKNSSNKDKASSKKQEKNSKERDDEVLEHLEFEIDQFYNDLTNLHEALATSTPDHDVSGTGIEFGGGQRIGVGERVGTKLSQNGSSAMKKPVSSSTSNSTKTNGAEADLDEANDAEEEERAEEARLAEERAIANQEKLVKHATPEQLQAIMDLKALKEAPRAPPRGLELAHLQSDLLLQRILRNRLGFMAPPGNSTSNSTLPLQPEKDESDVKSIASKIQEIPSKLMNMIFSRLTGPSKKETTPSNSEPVAISPLSMRPVPILAEIQGQSPGGQGSLTLKTVDDVKPAMINPMSAERRDAMGVLTQYPSQHLIGTEEMPSYGDYEYGCLIDAGSTGSRIFLYRWHPRRRSLHSSTYHSSPGPKPPFSRPVSRFDWSMKLSPGIHTFAENPALAGFSLVPLIEFVYNLLASLGQEHRIPTFPIYFTGTGGLRSLPRPVQQSMIRSVRRTLSQSGFLCEPTFVRIVSGEEEGVWGWLSVNYLHSNRTLFWNEDGSTEQTVGALDMGGASVQLSYRPFGMQSQSQSLVQGRLRSRTESSHRKGFPTSSQERPKNQGLEEKFQERIHQDHDQEPELVLAHQYPLSLAYSYNELYTECFWYFGKDSALWRIHSMLFGIYTKELSMVQAAAEDPRLSFEEWKTIKDTVERKTKSSIIHRMVSQFAQEKSSEAQSFSNAEEEKADENGSFNQSQPDLVDAIHIREKLKKGMSVEGIESERKFLENKKIEKSEASEEKKSTTSPQTETGPVEPSLPAEKANTIPIRKLIQEGILPKTREYMSYEAEGPIDELQATLKDVFASIKANGPKKGRGWKEGKDSMGTSSPSSYSFSQSPSPWSQPQSGSNSFSSESRQATTPTTVSPSEALRQLEEGGALASKAVVTFASPCLPKGFHAKFNSFHSVQGVILGDAQWELCYDLASYILKTRLTGPCATNAQVHSPFPGTCTSFLGMYKQDFSSHLYYGFSGLSYLPQFLQLSPSASLLEIKEVGKKICSLSWDQLQALFPELNPYYLRSLCWLSVYSVALLHEGFEFPVQNTPVLWVSKINGSGVSYALGAMLYFVNQLPWRIGPNAAEQTQIDKVFYWQMIAGTLAFGFAGVVLYLIYDRLTKDSRPNPRTNSNSNSSISNSLPSGLNSRSRVEAQDDGIDSDRVQRNPDERSSLLPSTQTQRNRSGFPIYSENSPFDE